MRCADDWVKMHTLPLLPMALAIINSVPKMVSRDHLFGARGDGYTRWADGKAALDKRSGVTGWVLNDTRRTVATRMADLGVQPHIIETVLNHQSGHRGHLQQIDLQQRGAQRVGAVARPRAHPDRRWRAQAGALHTCQDGLGRLALAAVLGIYFVTVFDH